MDSRTAIYRYCNYQERSHYEVRNKLYEIGADSEDINMLIAELIEANLLNEERFAISFARGRFRIKYWGRVKISQHLQQYRISAYLIKKALAEIDLNEYFTVLKRLAEHKLKALERETDLYTKRSKIYKYLQQKGYEPTIIAEILAELLGK